MNRIAAVRLATVLLVAFGTGALAGDDPRSPLGTNLVGIADFSDEFPFVDLMKTSRQWIPGRATCFDCANPPGPPFQNPDCEAPNVCPTTLALDADGYVAALDGAIQQKATTAIYADGSSGRFATGDYTMLFDGVGTLQFLGAAVVSEQPGRIVFNVTDALPGENKSFFFSITALPQPANPIRNIRIHPPGGVCSNDVRRACNGGSPCASGGMCQAWTDPGVAAAHTFQPRFLANTAPYRVLRFMDWMGTNFSPVVAFADYPRVASAFWDRVPPPVLAQLGNELASDIWINIPHLADDAFVDQFATVLRNTFRADRRIYIEYSNELWNGVFDQHREVPRAACPGFPDIAAGCQDDGVPGNGIACELNPVTFSYGNAGGPCFEALLRRQADRSVEVFARFDAVFGASARQRLVRVIASQAANPDVGRRVLARAGTAAVTDAYAISPYFGNEYCGFGGTNPDTHPAVFASADTLLDDIAANSLPQSLGFVTQSKAMLADNGFAGVRLIAYEGGQHLVRTTNFGEPGFPPGPLTLTCETRFDEANRSPRMGALYTTYLAGWHANGGDEFVHFYNAGRWGFFGRWGALEFQDQSPASSPKYSALTVFIASNPCAWPACTQAGELILRDGFESP